MLFVADSIQLVQKKALEGVGDFTPLNTQLNPICHLLALLGAYSPH